MSKTCLNPQPEPAGGSRSGGGAERARGGTWQSGAVAAGGRVGSFLQFEESAKQRAHTRMVDEESGSCDVSHVNSCAAGVFSLS